MKIRRLFLFVLAAVLMISCAVQAELILPEETIIIEEAAFMGDTSLDSVIIPEGCTTIGQYAFSGSSVTSVYLPSSLVSIGQGVFDGCPSSLYAWGPSGTVAEQYCKANSIPYRAVSKKVGISLPSQNYQRWMRDGFFMKTQLEHNDCEVILKYADNDLDLQHSQVSDMIRDGVQALIIAPVYGREMDELLAQAKSAGIVVIAYDRLITGTMNVDYYVTFDNYGIGMLQGAYIRDALRLDAAVGPFTLEITAGDEGDVNALYFYQGAIDVLQPCIENGRLTVKSGQIEFADVATGGWRTDNAQNRASGIVTSFYADGSGIDAWLCSNDSTALGVIGALENGYHGEWPIITGQDCDIENVKKMIEGKQSMSVFKETSIIASQAASIANDAISHKTPATNAVMNNGAKDVPSYLCMPLVVTESNYYSSLVESGWYSADSFQ